MKKNIQTLSLFLLGTLLVSSIFAQAENVSSTTTNQVNEIQAEKNSLEQKRQETLRQKFSELSRDQKIELLNKLRSQKLTSEKTTTKTETKKITLPPKKVETETLESEPTTTSDKKNNLIQRIKTLQAQKNDPKPEISKPEESLQAKNITKETNETSNLKPEPTQAALPQNRNNRLINKADFFVNASQKNTEIETKNVSEEDSLSEFSEAVSAKREKFKAILQKKRLEQDQLKTNENTRLSSTESKEEEDDDKTRLYSQDNKKIEPINHEERENHAKKTEIKAAEEANQKPELPKKIGLFNAISEAKNAKAVTEEAIERRTAFPEEKKRPEQPDNHPAEKKMNEPARRDSEKSENMNLMMRTQERR